LEILNTIDYKSTYTKVICVETLSYFTKGKGKKDINIINFLQEQDYILYAYIYINSIFFRCTCWVGASELIKQGRMRLFYRV